MAKVITSLTSNANRLVSATRPKLTTAWRYTRTELRPPTFGEFPEIGAGFKNLITSARTGGYKKLTVKEAWLNTLVGAEIFFWFIAGECIGKGSIIGYNIPGAANWDIHF